MNAVKRIAFALLLAASATQPARVSEGATALDIVNGYRAQFGAAPVAYNDTLEASADQWAQRMVAAKALQHDANARARDEGENLAIVSLNDSSGGPYAWWSAAIGAWFDERPRDQYYDFSDSTANFTQLVWKATTSLGLGAAVDAKNMVYAVMRFYPAGNVLGQFAANVGRSAPGPPSPSVSPSPSQVQQTQLRIGQVTGTHQIQSLSVVRSFSTLTRCFERGATW